MGRRILNRKDLRADFDAAEARGKEEAEEVEDEVDDDEDEDDEDEDGEEADEDADAEPAADADEDDEEAPVVKKKAKKPAKVKVVKPKRVRTPKHVRQRIVWVVLDNSSKKIATYEYPKKQEAEEHAARLKTEKNQTFFVQPLKELIEEEKKEK